MKQNVISLLIMLGSLNFSLANFGLTSVQASEKFESTITILDLEQQALIHHPGLKSSYHEWKANLAEVALARSLPDPQFSYTEFIEEVQTRVGPQRRKLSLSQMFPWFGTLSLREKAAMAKAAMAEQKMDRVKAKVLYDLRLAVVEIQWLDLRLKVNREHLVILKDLEKSQQGGLQSGRGDLSTVLRIQVECEKMKDEIASLISLQDPLYKKLEKALGSPLLGKIPQDLVMPNSIPDKIKLEELYYQNNPEWLSQQKNKIMSSSILALAQKKNYPDLGVGVSWIDTGPAVMPNVAGSGDDPWAITLNLSLPLWRGKNRAGIESAQDRLQAVQDNDQTLRDEFLANAEMVLYKLHDARRKMTLYREELLPKARDASLASRKANEAGKVSFQSLLDAERMVLRFGLDEQMAKVDFVKYNAELEMLLGASLQQHPPQHE